jgi:hypothetical protein
VTAWTDTVAPRSAPPSGWRPRGAVILGAVLTAAFVGVGARAGVTILPQVESPQEVTKAYAAALYDGDWPAILELSCNEERQYYAARASWERPDRHEYDITVGELELVPDREKPTIQVPYRLSSQEGRAGEKDDRFKTAAWLVREEGEFRICGMAMLQ